MTPVKVNVYISYAPEDRKAVEKLRDWLYPMRDEVNIWFNDPPEKTAPLPLPWEIISIALPIFRPYTWKKEYEKMDKMRKERAHIYLFLTSYKSLTNNRVDEDITLAVERRIEGEWLSPRIYPLLLAPSLWKEKSRLAQYPPIGHKKKTLAEIKPEGEGYLEIANQLSKAVKDMQRDLDEAKFAQSRLVAANTSTTHARKTQSYLGDDDESLDFETPTFTPPPEWLGWAIIIFLIVSVGRGLQGSLPDPDLTMYRNARGENKWQPEYARQPTKQPEATMQFPLPE